MNGMAKVLAAASSGMLVGLFEGLAENNTAPSSPR
jgi:hypothetical protein